MKHTTLVFLFALICGTAFSQYDYCSQIRKADESAKHNFAFNLNFKYQAADGFKVYSTNYSFSKIHVGYIYRNDVKREFYFQQKLSIFYPKFAEIAKAMEACLVKDTNYWIKTESEDKQRIAFFCAKTGSTFMISSDESYGVILRIKRSEKKDISIFSITLLYDIGKVVDDPHWPLTGASVPFPID